MRILHFTQSPPDYIPPPPLAADQVVAGPRYPDRVHDGRLVSINTPLGAIDAAAVMERLPMSWRPDLVVVRTDATAECRPANLQALKCPALLVVGDTHHRVGAISGVIEYATSERFAAVCLDYTRQHAHFLLEAGLGEVVWLPGLNVARSPERCGSAFDRRFTMIGSVHYFHVRRGGVCRGLLQAGLPLQVLQATNQDSRRLHAASQLSLNCSLNGDLNLRVLEVLQVGGALLTDRLAPEAGLDLLAEDGVHLCTYGSTPEAVQAARELLKDPDRCTALGSAGQAHYERTVAPETMAAHLLAMVNGAMPPDMFHVRHDPRTRLIDPSGDRADLMRRVAAYEAVQLLHLRKEQLTLLAAPSVPARMLADLVDLPRLRVLREQGQGWPHVEALARRATDMLQQAGLESRAPVMDPADPAKVDVILFQASDAGLEHLRAMLARHPNATVVPVGPVDAAVMGTLGLQPDPDTAGVWTRPPRKPPAGSRRR
jgi:hypothetical protein